MIPSVNFDIVTIFPDFFAGPLDHGIVRRARAAGLVEIRVHDLRNFTTDKHRTVDDRLFGGGEGMLLKPEPIFAAVESLFSEQPAEERRQTAVVLLSAQGRLFNQSVAHELAQRPRLVLLCGRYKGVDERVIEHLAPLEISIGDFVLSGGELAAAVVVDAVTRLLPGALSDPRSAVEDSFTVHSDATVSAGGILDCPHYTRPADFRGRKVPEVLLSGNHEEVRRWRRRQALAKTRRNRPDLLERAALSDDDRALLEELGEP